MRIIGWAESRKRERRRRRRDGDRLASSTQPAGLEALEPRLMMSATSVPVFHSLPGASAAIYLDFDGHFEPQWGAYANISSPAYDIDSSPDVFSDTELANIQEIWARVAEDFAPFNIDVTTQSPGSFGNGEALRVVIGGSSYDWFGSGAGGVSYHDTFTNSIVNTVYVFPKQLSNGNAKYVADAVSHESGHALGLEHQSRWSGGVKTQEHNAGGDGWAPIMGNAYSQPLGTWHNGQNASGALQDDMAMIARTQNGFGYRVDDHGNGNATATALTTNSATVSATGVIGRNDDIDAFSFDTSAGLVTFDLRVAPSGANLDARLWLYNSSGGLVASVDPSTSQGAMLSATVSAGRYFLHVGSTGLYGRIGQYTLSGTIVPSQSAPQPQPEVAVSLSGQGITDGQSTAVDFGQVEQDSTGPTRTFTVANLGDASLTLGSVTLPSGFTLVEPLSSTIAAGGSDTFTVRLDTASAGDKSGSLSFSTNDADEPVFDFPISGRVVAPPPPGPAPQPEVAVSLSGQGITDGQSTAVDFGQVEQGSAGPTRTFTVANLGDASLTLGSVTLPSGFTLVEPLSSTIAAGASDTFSVRLDTTFAGEMSGTLSFSTNDADESVFDFPISGRVVAPPAPEPVPEPEVAVTLSGQGITDGQSSAVDFGQVEQGSAEPTRTFTVVNSGDAALTLGSVALPAGFTLVEPLASVIAAGASDTFTVRLETSSAGDKWGHISFSTNDGDESVYNFPIAGRVLTPPPPAEPLPQPEVTVTLLEQGIADGQSAATDLGQAEQGGAGPLRTFTVRNIGDASLTLGTINLPAGFTLVEPLDATIAAGGSDTFTVRLDTVTVGVKSGTVTFSTNDTDESPFDFTIRGSVTAAPTQVPLERGRPLTFTDGQGQPVTVRLRGAGDGYIAIDEDGGSPTLVLEGTTGRSILTISAADQAALGGIIVDGSLRRIDARNVDLLGDLTVSGRVRAVRLGDVAGEADQTLSFGASPRARSIALSLGELRDVTISSASPIKSLRVESWNDSGGAADLLEAPRISKLKSLGDFGADVAVSEARKRPALGRMIVAGAMAGSEVRSAGRIGRVTAGAMRDSQLFAGIAEGVQGLPSQAADFDALRSIRSVRIRGLDDGGGDFSGSTIAAWSVRNARLGHVATDNDGATFGLAMGKFRGVTYRRVGAPVASPPVRIKPEIRNDRGTDAARSDDLPDGDFLIRLF